MVAKFEEMMRKDSTRFPEAVINGDFERVVDHLRLYPDAVNNQFCFDDILGDGTQFEMKHYPPLLDCAVSNENYDIALLLIEKGENHKEFFESNITSTLKFFKYLLREKIDWEENINFNHLPTNVQVFILKERTQNKKTFCQTNGNILKYYNAEPKDLNY